MELDNPTLPAHPSQREKEKALRVIARHVPRVVRRMNRDVAKASRKGFPTDSFGWWLSRRLIRASSVARYELMDAFQDQLSTEWTVEFGVVRDEMEHYLSIKGVRITRRE